MSTPVPTERPGTGSLRRALLPLVTFAGILAIWQLAAHFGLLAARSLPSPVQCGAAFVELLADGRLLDDTIASLFRVTVGWYLAVLLAVPLGLTLGWHPALAQAINPLLQFLRPISPLAWIPLAMVWFGIGDPPAIFLIFLASFFPLAVATMGAVAAIKRLYVRAARNLGLSGLRLILRVVLPATLPSIIVSLRISVGIAWLVVVAAEMIAVDSGLGYLIIDARNALRLDLAVVGMVVIGVIGILLDRTIRRLEDLKSMRWSTGQSH